MNLKNIKVNRNTAIAVVAILAVVAVVAVVPNVLVQSLQNLTYVAAIVFCVSGTIWFWRHMK